MPLPIFPHFAFIASIFSINCFVNVLELDNIALIQDILSSTPDPFPHPSHYKLSEFPQLIPGITHWLCHLHFKVNDKIMFLLRMTQNRTIPCGTKHLLPTNFCQKIEECAEEHYKK